MSARRQPAGAGEEREVKLAVSESFVMPQLDVLDGVTVVDRGEKLLRSVYWDTGDLALFHAEVGLRHRNGTWTFKGTSRREGDAVVREEIEVDAPEEELPPALARRVGAVVHPARVRPVAELRTARHTFDLAGGAMRAELVRDRVEVVDGDSVLDAFAEVEVEYPEGSAPLAERVVAMLVAAGAVVDTTPKYLRALRARGLAPASDR